MTWDHQLFLWLNFDGGAIMDAVMVFASGKVSWAALYILILWLTWRKYGWRGVALAILAIVCAVGISDMVAGIFKHTGPLKHLWSSFPARLRPMYTPELEGLVHSVMRGGQNGTVSAHASTSVSIGLIATLIINRRWFSVVMWSQVAMVCYSRIYLGYHFPQDIILGIGVGVISGLLMWQFFRWSLNLWVS